MERRLYEASLNGNVLALKTLMEEDELILDRVTLTSFDETLLHIAAMRGHLNFTRELLMKNPRLATELDSSGRSPLHLACAEGHAQIARELLLQVNEEHDVCRNGDQDGRTPLHFAAMKGRVEVIRELIQARPDCIYQKLDRGDTALHLCVKYNRLDALKLLVDYSVKNEEEYFLNSKDDNGNTILHLAVILKQMEIIKYLCSSDLMKEHANSMNVNGCSALDILEHCPRDLKSLEIREYLLQAGVRRAQDLGTLVPQPQPQSQNILSVTVIPTNNEAKASSADPLQNCFSRAWKLLSIIWKSDFKIKDKWLEDARGNLIIAATLTATVAFQAGLNPPGGVWQDESEEHDAGTSIAQDNYSYDYNPFVTYNTMTLLASLSIILLMISGFPLKNKLSLWLLTIAMCTTLTFMAVTYLISLGMVAPGHSLDDVSKLNIKSIFCWVGVCALTALVQTLRFLWWLVTDVRVKWKRIH